MTNQLVRVAAESGIEQTKAQGVLQQFTAFFEAAAEWEAKTRDLVITDASQTAEMKLARDARLNLRTIRTNAEKTKTRLKAGILVEGKLIDSMYNVIRGITEPIEKDLLEKEQFAERQEAARKAALKERRIEILAQFGVDGAFYQLSDMPDETFVQLTENSRLAYEKRLEDERKAEAARIEAERLATEQRIAAEKAEAEERLRIAEENARLKAEADAREKAIAIEREAREREIAEERARVEAERKAAEEQARIEREARERADKIEREKHAEEMRKKNEEAAAARAALEKIEREKREAEAAEKKRQEDERIAAEEKKRMAEQAGDREKIIAYLKGIVEMHVPEVKSAKAKQILTIIRVAVQTGISEAEKMK